MDPQVFQPVAEASPFVALLVAFAGVLVGTILGFVVHAAYTEKQQANIMRAMNENYDNVLRLVRK